MLIMCVILFLVLSFTFPIVCLIMYEKKSKQLKKKHDENWEKLHDQIKDDPDALKLYKALSLLR